MAFRTVVNGRHVEADTFEQFQQLLAYLEADAATKAKAISEAAAPARSAVLNPSQAPVASSKTPANPKLDAATKLIEKASSEAQERLVRELAGGEKTDEALREALGFTNNKALAGVLSSLTKRGRGAGLTPKEVLVRKVRRGQDGSRTYTYRLGRPMAEAYAARNGQRSLL
jgi:hypothetical protein